MKIAISTNWEAGSGLAVDYRILRADLEAFGCEVLPPLALPAPETPSVQRGDFDLLIALEGLVPRYVECAPRVWFVPNLECWHGTNSALLARCERIVCKTKNAVSRLWDEQAPEKTTYLGFRSEDRRDPDVVRERAFLHVAGGSDFKGTAAVLDAWESLGGLPLTVVGESGSGQWSPRDVPGVSYVRHYTPEAHRAAQNRHLFHLCPSEYEGWGHTLHEALSVGAITLAQNHPPADEFKGVSLLVPPRRFRRAGRAHLAVPDPAAIAEGVRRLWALSEPEIESRRAAARSAFEAESASYRERLGALIRLTPPTI